MPTNQGKVSPEKKFEKLELSLEIMEAHSFFTNTNNAGRCSAPAS